MKFSVTCGWFRSLCISLCSSAGMCSTPKYWYVYWTTQRNKKTWGSLKQETQILPVEKMKPSLSTVWCLRLETSCVSAFRHLGRFLASLKPAQHRGVTSPSPLTGTDGGCFMLVWATSGITTKVVEEKNTDVFILGLWNSFISRQVLSFVLSSASKAFWSALCGIWVIRHKGGDLLSPHSFVWASAWRSEPPSTVSWAKLLVLFLKNKRILFKCFFLWFC